MSRTEAYAPVDCMILALVQIIQPVSSEEAFYLSKGSRISQTLTSEQFKTRFQKLGRKRHLWKTAEGRYIVTPSGDKIARLGLDSRERDKLRLLLLNRRRHEGS